MKSRNSSNVMSATFIHHKYNTDARVGRQAYSSDAGISAVQALSSNASAIVPGKSQKMPYSGHHLMTLFADCSLL